MPPLIGEAGFMALCCLLLVVLTAVYPVVAFQAGEQAGVQAGVVTRGLSETALNNSQPQVPNLRSRKVILPGHQTLDYDFCSGKDISIAQNPSGFSGSGIPEFHVEILNNCYSNCPPSNIHLHCGEFASAELVNPNTFKRIANDDCLVNGGKAMPPGTLIAFTYANSRMYNLNFKSARFCWGNEYH